MPLRKILGHGGNVIKYGYQMDEIKEVSMGTWDTGLYQNDLSLDVKDDYIMKLKQGKSDEEALREILSEYKEESEDIDCKHDYYLALADTMWKKGRLTEEIRIKALQMIEEDKVSERWQSEKIRKERIKVLDKLKLQFEGTMPERKKVSVHKPYVLGWEEGDVYYFQIQEEIKGYEKYLGWYALFYVDKIYLDDWNVRGIMDEVADAYFFLNRDKPNDIEDFYTSKRVCFNVGKSGNRYRVCILERTKRNRPKDLTFLGKCYEFDYPLNDTIEPGCFFWSKYVDTRNILWGYENQLKLERNASK